MDEHIEPHVEFDVTKGDHHTMLKNVTSKLKEPAEYFYRANRGVRQLVIRLRARSANPRGLRVYMEPGNLYITGFSSGRIFEFLGHTEHEHSTMLPYNSSYVTIDGASLGRESFETAVILLIEQANAAQPPLADMQKSIFVIIHHISEAVRLRSVSNILVKARKNKQPIVINDLILRQFNNWKSMSIGIGDYVEPVDLTKEEKDMLHGIGEWGTHPYSVEAMEIILKTPRFCAYLVKVKWQEVVPLPPKKKGKPGKSSKKKQ